MVSLSSLVTVDINPRAFRYNSNEIDEQLRKMMIKPNYHAYKPGVTILRYDKDPISGQQYPSSGNILQEDLHQMLNNIIAHENSKNVSAIFFEEKS
jgi:hypothetical protein